MVGIEIQSLEEGFMARGHHGADEFHLAVREYSDQWIPPQGVVHEWWRCIPANDDPDYSVRYIPARAGSRGAFAVTYTHHDGPRCVWCKACVHKRRTQWREMQSVRDRKHLLRIWREASAGKFFDLDWSPTDDGEHIEYAYYPYRDIDEQRRREEAAAA